MPSSPRFNTQKPKCSFCVCLPDEPRSADGHPSQTEMALIYQSAAWILAGLLLAIIVFLVVAILINKKKKWVQMSCYSAPKKVRRSPEITSFKRVSASQLIPLVCWKEGP